MKAETGGLHKKPTANHQKPREPWSRFPLTHPQKEPKCPHLDLGLLIVSLGPSDNAFLGSKPPSLQCSVIVARAVQYDSYRESSMIPYLGRDTWALAVGEGTLRDSPALWRSASQTGSVCPGDPQGEGNAPLAHLQQPHTVWLLLYLPGESSLSG